MTFMRKKYANTLDSSLRWQVLFV